MKRLLRRLLTARHVTWGLLVLSWGALIQLSCASSNGAAAHPALEELWREFRKMPAERALAVSGDPERQWLGAAVGGRESQAEAKRDALEECRKRRILRRVQWPCRLYAVGDEIVWEPW